MSMFSTAMFLELMSTVGKNIHEWAKEKGFWDEQPMRMIDDGCMGPQEVIVNRNPWNFGEKIALVHSELSEALEAHRGAGKIKDMFGCPYKINDVQWWSEDGGVYRSPSTDMPIGKVKPEGVAIELADAVIRIMDLCAKMEIDLGQAILDKMEYNRTRPMKHGKSY